MKPSISIFVVLLGITIPAFAELAIHTKDGRTIKVPVDANEIARIEFVAQKPDAPVEPAFLKTIISGKERSGEAWTASGSRWRFGLKITSFDGSTGAFSGQIVWPSLSSIHRIQGNVAGDKLSFTEVEAIQAGSAHLHVSYVFTLGKNDANGTWVDNGDRSRGEAKIK